MRPTKLGDPFGPSEADIDTMGAGRARMRADTAGDPGTPRHIYPVVMATLAALAALAVQKKAW